MIYFYTEDYVNLNKKNKKKKDEEEQNVDEKKEKSVDMVKNMEEYLNKDDGDDFFDSRPPPPRRKNILKRDYDELDEAGTITSTTTIPQDPPRPKKFQKVKYCTFFLTFLTPH